MFLDTHKRFPGDARKHFLFADTPKRFPGMQGIIYMRSKYVCIKACLGFMLGRFRFRSDPFESVGHGDWA